MDLKRLTAIGKALGDESRVRALMALTGGELCLCELIWMLELAPSTVSRHMNLLLEAGLVQRRKQGKWHYFSLPEQELDNEISQALQWICDSMRHDSTVHGDMSRRREVSSMDEEELCKCYRK